MAAVHARLAIAGGTQLGARVDPGRDAHVELGGLVDPPFPPAFAAGFVDPGAGAMAGWADLADGEKPARGRHLAGAPAGRTRHAFRARLRAGAVAMVARGELAERNLLLHAPRGLLERDLDVVAQVGPVARPVATAAAKKFLEDAATAAAKHLAKNVERIVEAARGPARAARPRPLRECRVAVAVVGGAFVGILEHLVGLGDFLEHFLGRLAAGIFVGMILDRLLAIGFLDLLLRGIPAHAEQFIIVFLGHEWLGRLRSLLAGD